MPIAYEGPKPYIFVSYSHRDMQFVHQVISYLQNAGYRVWFDGGIEAGSEWPEYIANHLEGCVCVLSFISNTFVASDNCKRELNFSQNLQKPMLNVHIEEVSLTAGMRMQLGLSQAMYRSNFRSDEEFMEALSRARILEPCLEKPVKKEETKAAVPKDPESSSLPKEPDPNPVAVQADMRAAPLAATAVEKKSLPDKFAEPQEDSSTPAPMPIGMKLLGWLTILLELSYCWLYPHLLNAATKSDIQVWLLILGMMLPHILIALINSQLIKAMKPKTHASQRDNLMTGLVFLGPVVAVVASLFGISSVQYAVNTFLKVLISVGLNVIPAVVVFFLYAFMLGESTRKKK